MIRNEIMPPLAGRKQAAAGPRTRRPGRHFFGNRSGRSVVLHWGCASAGPGRAQQLPSRCSLFHRIQVEDDVITPRPSVAVCRHFDWLPYGRASRVPSAVEVQADHRHHAHHAGALYRRDDGDLFVGLLADVEAAAVSGAGADCGAVHVRGQGWPEPHAGQHPVLPRLLAERGLLRESWAVDVLLQPGWRQGFCRPCTPACG